MLVTMFVLATTSVGAIAQDQSEDSQPPDESAETAAETTVDPPQRTTNFLGLDAAPLRGSLVTDRPDFTESTVTIPRGRAQLEAGYTFTYDKEKDVRTKDHTFPELLLRVGLADDLELRIGWAGWSLAREMTHEPSRAGRRVSVESRDNGGTDMSLGLKFHLLDQDGWVPDFGVIVAADLPTGAGGKTSGDVDPFLGLLWAYDLTDRWALAGNVNLAVPTSERGRFFQTSASVSAAFALTDELGAYVEYFGFYPNDRGADAAHSLNGGFTYLITDNFQIDVLAGFGLNEEADDFFAGAGFAWRF